MKAGPQNAAIVSIGDELLIGQVINSNASWISERLDAAGYHVTEIVAVGDEESAIHDALDRLCRKHSLVILTGGLGPTHDDMTREAVASFCGRPLERNQSVWEHLSTVYRRRGRKLTKAAEKMADVPRGFSVLENRVGTAPGLWLEDEHVDCLICLLPGVPREMRAIVTDELLPRLRRGDPEVHIRHKTLQVAGAGESDVSEKLQPIDDLLAGGVKVAFLPSTLRGVRLRISAVDKRLPDPAAAIDDTERRIRDKIGDLIYGTEDDLLEEVVGRLLLERNRTLAIAESCTGGLIAHRLTNVAGSSAYVRGAAITYSNESKTDLLGVDGGLIAEYGAVSEPVVCAMAEGVRRVFGSTDGLASTGIAGPGGGSEAKPVGTIWIAHANEQETVSRGMILTLDRRTNKELTSTRALDLLRLRLLR